jgi:hypothetical protein
MLAYAKLVALVLLGLYTISAAKAQYPDPPLGVYLHTEYSPGHELTVRFNADHTCQTARLDLQTTHGSSPTRYCT